MKEMWWCSDAVTVPAHRAAALERLADTSTLGARAPSLRMLVIANPYATSMSERLRTLVVYALQGRYRVDAVDTERQGHAILHAE
jgi:hypothetical protein